MHVPTWLRLLTALNRTASTRQATRRCQYVRWRLESLEDRCVPASQFTETLLPTRNSIPDAITLGPDGNIWFTEFNFSGGGHGRIGRLVADGHIDEFVTPAPHARYIIAGPDG